MKALRPHGTTIAIAAAILVLAVGLAASGAFSGRDGEPNKDVRPSAAMSSSPYGAIAHVTAKALATSIHPRAADTWGDIDARSFVFDTLQRYGYYPRTQEFISGSGAKRVHSANIVAVKDGDSAEQIVVGAHYDSKGPGEGYTDNATGLGLLLEAAARLKSCSTPYTVVFVALGADESGSLGAEHFVRTMGAAQQRATLGVIVLNTVAGGSRLVATSRSGTTWLRDDTLSAAKSLRIPLHTPLHTRSLAAGEAPFAAGRTATMTLTSAGWAPLGSPPQHTRKDSVAILEKTYPGRVRRQLGSLSRLLETMLTSKLEKHL